MRWFAVWMVLVVMSGHAVAEDSVWAGVFDFDAPSCQDETVRQRLQGELRRVRAILEVCEDFEPGTPCDNSLLVRGCCAFEEALETSIAMSLATSERVGCDGLLTMTQEVLGAYRDAVAAE